MAEGFDIRQFTDQASQTSRQEMSDNYLSSEDWTSRETSVDSQDLKWHQLYEYDLVQREHKAKRQKVEPKGAKCDSKECIISVSGNFALYLCYVCNLLLCGECFVKHDKTHEFVSVESETDERRRMAEMFMGRMRSERLGRGIDFDKEDVRVHGRVNVKHQLDKSDCHILGLSGLENKRWVAVDSMNDCIKIFCSVSNTLLRYIKVGSKPFDVTEIKVKQKSTDVDSASSSITDISVAARDEQRFLAVTFPSIKQIWFIDLNKTQAVKNETIKTDKECCSIEFSEDKIFTLCKENVESASVWSICILTIEGNLHKVIKNPGISTAHFPDLAVHNGRGYLSDPDNDKVLCMDVKDGETISELQLKRGSNPRGISVDHNSGVVYLCRRFNNKVYKLSPDLNEYEPLSLGTDYTRIPDRLCLMNNKLYISHWPSFLRNGVTVVQLLT